MIDIEKLSHFYEIEEPEKIVFQDEFELRKFAEVYAAKVLEDKYAEIAELKSTVKKWQENSVDLEYRCLDKNILIAELKSNINDLRETLEWIDNSSTDGMAVTKAHKALLKTPAHDAVIFTKKSLQQHINDVIEICACVCTKSTSKYEAESKIRALKA